MLREVFTSAQILWAGKRIDGGVKGAEGRRRSCQFKGVGCRGNIPLPGLEAGACSVEGPDPVRDLVLFRFLGNHDLDHGLNDGGDGGFMFGGPDADALVCLVAERDGNVLHVSAHFGTNPSLRPMPLIKCNGERGSE